MFTYLLDQIVKNSNWVPKINIRFFFHIHGGGFSIGSGSETWYNLSSFAARHDVVGVNLNYRLNILGFLSYPPLIENNLGFKDQRVALKWVHDNIANFGGDPEKVTLYGCSAGGCAVHYHMLQPESSQYFSRAIASSGTVNKVWSRFSASEQRKKVLRVVRMLGGPTGKRPSDQEVVHFLMELDVDKIREFIKSHVIDATVGFAPVDEFPTEREISKTRIAKKPFLLGCVSQEGSMFGDMFFQRKNNRDSTWSREVFGDYFGEKTFYEPLRSLLGELQTVPNMPVYVYLFDYKCTTRSENLPESEVPLRYGSFHSLDIPFLFNLVSEGSDFITPSEDDIKVNDACQKMLAGFIKCENVAEIPLQGYDKNNQCVNKISEEGLRIIGAECFLPKRSGLGIKATTAAALLKMSPEKY